MGERPNVEGNVLGPTVSFRGQMAKPPRLCYALVTAGMAFLQLTCTKVDFIYSFFSWRI